MTLTSVLLSDFPYWLLKEVCEGLGPVTPRRLYAANNMWNWKWILHQSDCHMRSITRQCHNIDISLVRNPAAVGTTEWPPAFWLINSVQFSLSVMSVSLWPHESQHARPPCPSPSPRVHSDSRPSSQWCHSAISSSVVPFSCPQSLPASKSFPMSQIFAWGGQSTGAQTNKVWHCFHSFPIYFPWSDGIRCHDLSFLNFEL